MTRIILIHWNASEALERARLLQSVGYEVEVNAAETREAMLALRQDPPAAFVIDLTRTPSRGRDLAIFLRQQKSTRTTPLVFAGGEAEKVERVRSLLPDAEYYAWEDLPERLAEAISRPVEMPIVPGAMDGYAGAPLVKKLGIRPGSRIAAVDPPDGLDRLLGTLPEQAHMVNGDSPADVYLLFARKLEELTAAFPGADARLAKGGKLWLIWPKKGSGVATDLTQNTVRAFGLNSGYVDYKISAIDETWSGLCFTRRAKA